MLVGDIRIHPLSDGTFRASPQYFGDHVTGSGHEDLFARDGQAWLPIGSFLIRSGERTVLVDAGMGPALRDDGERRLLIGGQLLVGLRAIGVTVTDIDEVICTHLHADHCGWLFDPVGRPVFPRAGVWFGAAEWGHFVINPAVWMHDHVRRGFLGAGGHRLHLVDRETTVVTGVDLVPAPGHTPGHLVVVISSRGQRVILLGDAMVCPVQVAEPTWTPIGDVDPVLAARTRERLLIELADESTQGVGAHFPELRFGRLIGGPGRRWTT